jgi:hypothetical protein
MLRFDTLKLARELTDAGMDPRQAEALVRGLGDMDTSELATKADLGVLRTELADVKTDMAEMRSELKTEMAELRSELKTEMADLRSELRTEIAGVKGEIAALKGEMFRFMYLQAMGIVGLTVALVKLLPG